MKAHLVFDTKLWTTRDIARTLAESVKGGSK
jgi:hypothetical protein